MSSFIQLQLDKEFRRRLSLILFALLLTISSFGQNTDKDRKIGAESAQMVEAQMGIYEHAELSPYVKTVGERLVAELEEPEFDFQFQIVDDFIPNAFALPGGYIYVTRGVLALIETEDELACVLGHEIIHVTHRHAIKQQRKGILPNILQAPGRLVGAVVSPELGGLINAPIAASNALLLASYSRKHERESDKLGIALAAKAGYDPNAMGSILERLSQSVEVMTSKREKKSYFDDHPYTPDRVESISEKWVPKIAWEDLPPIAADFPSPLDDLTYGPNPAQGLFREDRFLHPDLNFRIDFPSSWTKLNTPVFVGAVNENTYTALIVGIENEDKTVVELGQEFEAKLLEQSGKGPTKSQRIDHHGNEGYMVRITQVNRSFVFHYDILWIDMNGIIFRLVSFGPEPSQTQLALTINSLRPLSEEERASITRYVVRIVESESDKDLTAFNDRTHNVLDVKLTSLINGIDTSSGLQDGAKMKIVLEEEY